MDNDAVGGQIRVASIPYSQVYIRHLEAPTGYGMQRVRRLQDPDPDGGGKFTQSKWWPPVMLSAAWVAEHHAEFDLMHIHFGFDAITTEDLQALVDALRRHDKPLVYTVHDLRNPHHLDRRAHDAHLDILLPAADRVLTLTRGAAAEIQGRWGVAAVVLPHPHVVDFPTMERLQSSRTAAGRLPAGRQAVQQPSATRPFRIGVHLKSLRPNMEPAIVEALAAAVDGLDHVELAVNIHREVLDEASSAYRVELARQLHAGHAAGRWVLDAHEYYDEQAFFAYLASLDVSVLPYRFGTHSGWLEACRDVGTSVLAPTCGFYRDQHPSVVEYGHDEDGLDVASLRDAVHELHRRRLWPASTVAERLTERLSLAEAHERIYAQLLGTLGRVRQCAEGGERNQVPQKVR